MCDLWRTTTRLRPDFSIAATKARRQWSAIFVSVKRKSINLESCGLPYFIRMKPK